MTDTDDLIALQQAAQSVQDMREQLERISDPITDGAGEGERVGTTEAREEGFYWGYRQHLCGNLR